MSELNKHELLYQEEHGHPPPWLRTAVHGVLSKSNGFHELNSVDRKELARAMVKISCMAAKLIDEENNAEQQLPEEEVQLTEEQKQPQYTTESTAPQTTSSPKTAPVLAVAQSQPGFGESANRVATVTRNVLNAVSFPRFVTDLVNGVFKAMLDSSSQQMQMYVELLNNVSASIGGFEQTQSSATQVRVWLVDHFPANLELERADDEDEDDRDDEDPEDVEEPRLRLKSGAQMPTEEQLQATFGTEPGSPIRASNPEQLVPLARRQIARQRQQMLATMVTMGMQRIVIDSGKINASMRFHIDTRSAASEDRGSQFGMQNRVRASGSFGVGPWGASAEVENTISYVSTQRSQRTEEINTDLELNSSVELNFRTDYLPLNQMAAQAQADRIRRASLNPTATTGATAADRTARLQAQRTAERDRANRLTMIPPGTTPTATPRPATPRPATTPATTARPATPRPATTPATTARPATPRPATTPATTARPATPRPATAPATTARPATPRPATTPTTTARPATPATTPSTTTAPVA